MMLERMQSFEKKEDSLAMLDVSSLTEFQEIHCVAYVHNGYTGMSKLNQGFVTLILKDCNATVVRATLFNVAQFSKSGLTIAAFKRKPVVIHATVQYFNNQISLVLSEMHEIELYTGEFEYSRFVGELEFDSKFIQSVGERVLGEEFEFPERMRTSSLDNIAQGRVGGFGKVYELALSNLWRMRNVPGVPFKELMWAFSHAMIEYFDSISSEQTIDFLDGLNSYSVLEKINMKYRGNDNRLLVIDTVRSLLGFEKPRHLVAHLIYRSVTEAIKEIELALTSINLPLGSRTKVGGEDLLKY